MSKICLHATEIQRREQQTQQTVTIQAYLKTLSVV
ncbi:predicted protein [Botrytis cinerea T4]|uniref:Uncharacterized protein n=1 Tax=Botryotinia fuckeliana (strain T4) TaxID=999810 RepID=G2Y5B1_BOTF4|nr:predicted protein [Botrytis cinerea T4]